MSDFSAHLEEHAHIASTLPTDWEPTWIIEGLWQVGGITMMHGAQRTGKSRLRRYLLACAMSGKPAFGVLKIGQRIQKPLILIGEEIIEAESTYLFRMLEAMGAPELREQITIMDPDAGILINNPAHWLHFRRFVEERGFDLVFFDPLINFHEVPENDNTEMGKMLRQLRGLSQEVPTILNHHDAKLSQDTAGRSGGHRSRGGSVLPGYTINNIGVTRATNSRIFTLNTEAKYIEDLDELRLYGDPNGTFLLDEISDSRIVSTVREHPDKTATDLGKILGIRRKDLEAMLAELVKKGAILPKEGGRGRRIGYVVP